MERRELWERWRDGLLLLLAGTSGYLDAVSFFRLGGVFTAIMSGNTVILGVALSRGEWPLAERCGASLCGFALGVSLGAALVRPSREGRGWSKPVTVVLGVESAILLTLAATWQFAPDSATERPLLLLVLSAVGMGLQSVAMRRVGVPDVATTYVTGTLTGALDRLVQRLLPVRDPAASATASAASGWRLPATVWACSGLGAVAGGVAVLHLGGSVAWPAFAAAVGVVAAAHRGRGSDAR